MENSLLANRTKIIIFFILNLVSSMVVLEIDGKPMFFYIQLIYCAWYILTERKINLIKDKLFWIMYSSFVLTGIISWFSDIPYNYRYASLRSSVMITLLVFTIQFLNTQVVENVLNFNLIKKAIKCMCIIQLVWCVIAFLFYKIFEVDINQKIFVDWLALLENASCYKRGVFFPSGLSWHPATLVPIISLGYFLVDNLFVKGLAIIVAFISGSATALISVVLCVFFSAFNCIFCDKCKMKKQRLMEIAIVVILGIIVLVISGKYTIIIDKFSEILRRISGSSGDSSAHAHMRYYWSYPQILSNSTLYQTFWGYGNGCSGYPIGVLFGQYTDLGSWSVESDIMDILISRGIFGFVTFYAYLISIALQGVKIDKRYAYIVIVLVLSGITYNIQFQWCIFIEIILLIMIKHNYNIFSN